jgi:phage tail sheath gpL-like
MAVDSTAIARVVGIQGTYKDLRSGSVLFLPQQIIVIAQGSTGTSYSSAKWLATSAAAAGARYGYGSPIHLILRQLLPVNGDGVGTVPVYVLPLSDANGSAAATGGIMIGGSQTEAAEYRVKVSNIAGRAFSFAASDSSATRYRAIMDSLTPVLELPVTPTYSYSGVTSAAGGSNVGDGTCTSLSAPGQPVPGDWVLTCTAAVANGGTFKLTNPDGEDVQTGIAMTAGAGTATAVESDAGIDFTLTDATTDFAVGDKFTLTVTCDGIDLTSKWKGVSTNDLVIDVEDGDGGTTFTITQPTGGLVNPTVDSALELVGNQWATLGVNALNISDTTALDAYQVWGDGRWGALVNKPCVVFTGSTEADREDATAVTSARTDDKVNSQLVSPGSDDLPFVVAARQVARIAKIANNDPASDYGAQSCTGLTPGGDADQWDYTVRDQAVKAGSSTIEVVDGVVKIGDVVTMYAPTGEEPPAYRYVCDIVKLQNIAYNLQLKFASDDWVGKPLVPDDQPVTNKNARKPKHAKAVVANLIDALAAAAIISDPASAKETIVCTIDSQNPKRLNVEFTVQLSGNTNIIDVSFNWGFYFGTAAAA